MPVYEYECSQCHQLSERERKPDKRHSRTKCDHCGSWKTAIIISDNSFALQGSGWYVTDYKGKGRK